MINKPYNSFKRHKNPSA